VSIGRSEDSSHGEETTNSIHPDAHGVARAEGGRHGQAVAAVAEAAATEAHAEQAHR
jgi:hypothetical protein